MRLFSVSVLLGFLVVLCSSASGADSDILVADAGSMFDLSLDELLAIEIETASKVPEERSKSTSNVFVITAADLKRIGARSYHDALMMVPGFSVYRKGLGERVITLRGIHVSDSPGILILLNSHVLNPPRTGGATNQVVDEIPIESIKQIEIIRGPGSALYGANAFLAIINIITKNADEIDGLELSVGTEFGSGNDVGQDYNLLYGKVFENEVGLTLNVNWLNHGGPDLWSDGDAFGHTGHVATGREQLDLQFGLEKGGLRLSSRYFDWSDEAFFGVLDVLNDGSEQDHWGGHVEAEWDHEWSEDVETKLLAYVDHLALDNYYLAIPRGAAPMNSPFGAWNRTGMIGNIEINETSLGGDLQLTYRGWKNHIVVSGIAYRYESQHDSQFHANFNPGPLRYVRNVSNEYNWMDNTHRHVLSAYIEDIWDIKDGLRLTTGIRFDEFSDFGTTVNPRLGLAWKISDRFDTKISYGTAFRAPDFGAQFIRNNPAFTGNPNLNPEETASFEASVGYKHG